MNSTSTCARGGRMSPWPVLLLLLAAAWPGGSRAASLHGMVMAGELGLGIPGARVVLFAANNMDSLAQDITDDGGFYAMEGLEPQVVRVWAGHPDFHPSETLLLIEPGENLLDIHLMPLGDPEPATLEGWVLDAATGLPLAEALASWSGSPMLPPVTDHSDAEGRFLLEDLLSGPGLLTVTRPGYHPLALEMILTPFANEVTVGLLPLEDDSLLFQVSGQVLDLATRVPLPGARVCASPGQNGVDSLCTEAGGEGVFALVLPAEDVDGWWLTATAPGHHPGSVWVPAAQDHVWTELLLQPLEEPGEWGLLAGRVLREGEPLGGVLLEAISTNPAWDLNYFATTGPLGFYELHAPAGEWRLACHAPRPDGTVQTIYYPGTPFYGEAEILALGPGQVLDGLVFELPEGPGDSLTVHLDGQVTDEEGQALPGARVRFWTAEEELADAAVFTNEQGFYQTTLSDDRLPIVPFSLSAEATGRVMEFFNDAPSFTTATQFLLTGDAVIHNLDFRLAAAPAGPGLAGEVGNGAGPLGTGLVAALSPEGDFVTTVAADAGGHYQFAGLPDRELVLLFHAPGHLPVFSGGGLDLASATRLRPGQDEGEDAQLATQLPPAGPVSLAGLVTDNGGLPVSGALVMASTPATGDLRFAVSGPDGAYVVAGLASDVDIVLLISAPGWEVAQVELHTDSASQQVVPADVQLAPLAGAGLPDGRAARPRVALHPAAPNPFNPDTRLAFTLESPGPARLAVHDLRGAVVWERRFAHLSAGRHEVRFVGAGLPSGIYLCRLESAAASETRRLLLLK